MKKRFFSLLLAIILILSLNVVAFAEPGGSGAGKIPTSETLPIECLEDDQGEDDDDDQNQQ